MLAATIVTAAPVATVASPASADSCRPPTILSTELQPSTVVLGASKTKELVAYVSVSNDGCPVAKVTMTLSTPDHTSRAKRISAQAGGAGFTTYVGVVRLHPRDRKNTEAGTWQLRTAVTWSGSPVTGTTDFTVVRAARLSAKASPAKVSAGKTVTVTGHLNRANWQRAAYSGYVGRAVQLEFAPTGGDYAAVTTVRSVKGGALKASVPATVDGCYRFVFAGSSTTDDVHSKADCVDVR